MLALTIAPVVEAPSERSEQVSRPMAQVVGVDATVARIARGVSVRSRRAHGSARSGAVRCPRRASVRRILGSPRFGERPARSARAFGSNWSPIAGVPLLFPSACRSSDRTPAPSRASRAGRREVECRVRVPLAAHRRVAGGIGAAYMALTNHGVGFGPRGRYSDRARGAESTR